MTEEGQGGSQRPTEARALGVSARAQARRAAQGARRAAAPPPSVHEPTAQPSPARPRGRAAVPARPQPPSPTRPVDEHLEGSVLPGRRAARWRRWAGRGLALAPVALLLALALWPVGQLPARCWGGWLRLEVTPSGAVRVAADRGPACAEVGRVVEASVLFEDLEGGIRGRQALTFDPAAVSGDQAPGAYVGLVGPFPDGHRVRALGRFRQVDGSYAQTHIQEVSVARDGLIFRPAFQRYEARIGQAGAALEVLRGDPQVQLASRAVAPLRDTLVARPPGARLADRDDATLRALGDRAPGLLWLAGLLAWRAHLLETSPAGEVLARWRQLPEDVRPAVAAAAEGAAVVERERAGLRQGYALTSAFLLELAQNAIDRYPFDPTDPRLAWWQGYTHEATAAERAALPGALLRAGPWAPPVAGRLEAAALALRRLVGIDSTPLGPPLADTAQDRPEPVVFTATPTPMPTAAPTSTPTPSPTPRPTLTPSPSPTATPPPSPTALPVAAPVAPVAVPGAPPAPPPVRPPARPPTPAPARR